MINLFNKLEKENLLKQHGELLDLGCGNGKLSETFFRYGYNTTLVDKDSKTLSVAENNFKEIKKDSFKIVNSAIENFDFGEELYDGIIVSNVLPFQKDKESIERIVKTAFSKLNKQGFIYFTLFGVNDQWATEHADTMSFYKKNEALKILAEEPYFVSEDFGQGSTMKGDIKIWHIFHLLYVK